MIGDVKLADVLVAPSPEAGKEVLRLADWSPALGRWAADREMKVSTHFAAQKREGKSVTQYKCILRIFAMLTDDGFLVLATVVKLEQLARTQSKDHALVIFLQVIVHLRGDESRELPFRE